MSSFYKKHCTIFIATAANWFSLKWGPLRIAYAKGEISVTMWMDVAIMILYFTAKTHIPIWNIFDQNPIKYCNMAIYCNTIRNTALTHIVSPLVYSEIKRVSGGYLGGQSQGIQKINVSI